ncbi:MAG: hypothetical protein KGJ73_12165 [Rhodospirillales bacterium]|nr:hypothetical protein [Rhodospirillales bacterium]
MKFYVVVKAAMPAPTATANISTLFGGQKSLCLRRLRGAGAEFALPFGTGTICLI